MPNTNLTPQHTSLTGKKAGKRELIIGKVPYTLDQAGELSWDRVERKRREEGFEGKRGSRPRCARLLWNPRVSPSKAPFRGNPLDTNYFSHWFSLKLKSNNSRQMAQCVIFHYFQLKPIIGLKKRTKKGIKGKTCANGKFTPRQKVGKSWMNPLVAWFERAKK